ncbi:chemotaxis protein CheZ [Constrictibacter sp. MBR-5]|jgi:chemotaxis protein CheZ|uniref:protein phosphatase CheZ n=1 Tax=Constrictibacter sp. MBR-5 TaxID=3156467 RepID=UPI003397E6CE
MTTGTIEHGEVSMIVREIMTSLDGDLIAADMKLHEEITQLAEYIRDARREIAELDTDEIRRQHIPAATDELDAIVAATEEATGAILDSAELIEGVADGLQGEDQAKLRDATTKIFEACNFQDITGQRIGKIVRALKHIESKIESLVQTFGSGSAVPKPKADTGPNLLEGPALPGGGTSQEDIDKLLASFD